jgi:hypothetical protein
VAKAASWSSRRVYQLVQAQVAELSNLSIAILRKLQAKDLTQIRLKSSGGLVMSASGAVALLSWNWRLCLATGSGIGIMFLVYSFQNSGQIPWRRVHRQLQSLNRPVVIALASGGIATLSTYMMAVIWRDSTSPWLAAGSIMQGLGTLAVLILLARLILHRQAEADQSHFQRVVSDLTVEDDLKRLIAVRQLTYLCKTNRLSLAKQRMVGEYLRLLLSHEQASLVHNAALDGLQLLSQKTFLNPAPNLPTTNRSN